MRKTTRLAIAAVVLLGSAAIVTAGDGVVQFIWSSVDGEEGTAYVVDLALPTGDGWLSVTFGDRPGPAGGLHLSAEAEACLCEVEARLRIS